MITRGFRRGQSRSESKRLPPEQHLTGDFPVLSAAPTPHTRLDAWSFALETEDGTRMTAERVVARSSRLALGSHPVTTSIEPASTWYARRRITKTTRASTPAGTAVISCATRIFPVTAARAIARAVASLPAVKLVECRPTPSSNSGAFVNMFTLRCLRSPVLR
jgi:hypothetical protein